MIEKANTVHVGVISKPHGVGGEVVAHVGVGFDASCFEQEFLFVEIDGGLVPFHVAHVRNKNQEEAIVKFDFVDNQQEAKRFVQCKLYADRHSLVAADDAEEMQIGMLVGYECFTANGGKIGVITDIDEQNGTNPLFVVECAGDEVLIPIVDEWIVDIDEDKRQLSLDLPEGLIDL